MFFNKCNLFAPVRITAGAFSGFIEAFLFTRAFLSVSSFLTFIDVITDIIATVEFASPSDGGPPEKWWTAWSVFFLYIAFRAGLIRYFEFKNRGVPLTPGNILILTIPFSLNCRFKTNTGITLLLKEIAILLFFPFYPFLLLDEIVGLVRETWRRTGIGYGVPVGVTELAVLEIIESVSQFGIQTRAYTQRALATETYFLSAGFSLFSILRSIYAYQSNYHDIKVPSPVGDVWDCSNCGLQLLANYNGIRSSRVDHVLLNGNNFENVLEDEWKSFIFTLLPHTKYATLTRLDVSRCNLGDEGAKAIGGALKNLQKPIDKLFLDANNIGNSGAAAILSALLANEQLFKNVFLRGNLVENDSVKLFDQLRVRVDLSEQFSEVTVVK